VGRVSKADQLRNAGNGASANGAGGNGIVNTKVTPAQRLWNHAEVLSPKAPWKAVARALESKEQQALDAFRIKVIPPGVADDAVSRFLKLL
jgi:hypothetical protein